MLDVYRTFYKLTGEPFRLSPDHRFSLSHRSYANAKAYLDYALLQGEGFIAITGGPGTGKTTLISDILAGFEKTDIRVATLTSTQLESRDLLHMVAHSFDLHPEDRSKSNLLLELEQFLNQQSYRGHRSILIVDEAQSLSPSALEELRLLANLQRNHQLLLQIFLVGQEKLLDLIRTPGMEQLQQRLVAASVLEPLDLDETVDYVEHRLRLVAWQGDPAISEAALRLVHQYSGGIPRRINMICNRLFLSGGMQQKHEFDGEDARTVIEELRQEFLLPAEAPAEGTETTDVGQSADDSKTAERKLPRGDTVRKPSPQCASRDPGPQRRAKQRPPRPRSEQVATTRPGAGRNALPPRHAKDRSGRAAGRVHRQPVGRLNKSADRSMRAAEPEARQRKGRHWGLAAAGFILLAAAMLAAIVGTATRLEDLLKVAGLVEPDDTFDTPLQTSVHKALKVFQGDEEQVTLNPQSGPPRQPADPPGEAEVTPPASELGQRADSETATIEPPPVSPPAEAEEPIDTPPPVSSASVAMDSEESGITGPDTSEAEKPDERSDTVSAPPPTAAEIATNADEAVSRGDAEFSASAIQAEYGKLRQVAGERFSQRRGQVESRTEKVTPAPVKPSAAASAAGTSDPEVSVPRVSIPKVSEPGKAPVPMASTPKVSEPGKASVLVASAPKVSAPKASAPNVSTPKVSTPKVSTPKVSTPKASQPKITVARATAATTAERGVKKGSHSLKQIRSTLLEGQWTSQGKPASLLPSEITYCNSQEGERIGCWSVPQNIKTKYGPALYKVETTLQGFSAGAFKLSYRTLVKLVGDSVSESEKEKAASSEDGWQVSEHSMQCQLTKPDTVLCRDKKGVTRNYQRSDSKGRT